MTSHCHNCRACRIYFIATAIIAMCAITFGAFAIRTIAAQNANNEELAHAYGR